MTVEVSKMNRDFPAFEDLDIDGELIEDYDEPQSISKKVNEVGNRGIWTHSLLRTSWTDRSMYLDAL